MVMSKPVHDHILTLLRWYTSITTLEDTSEVMAGGIWEPTGWHMGAHRAAYGSPRGGIWETT